MFMFCTLFTLSTLVAPPSEAAEITTNHIRGVRFDAHANFGGYGSVGGGVRVDVPILSEGILEGVDDELAISPGLDVFGPTFYHDYYAGGPYLIPSAVMQWNFYVAPKWSVFPEAGLALYVGDADYLRHGHGGVYAAVALGVGTRYHFNDRNALLLRIATPTGLQLGITF